MTTLHRDPDPICPKCRTFEVGAGRGCPDCDGPRDPDEPRDDTPSARDLLPAGAQHLANAPSDTIDLEAGR